MTVSTGAFAAFAGEHYLSLETMRRDGTGVRTPVWFAADEAGRLYIYSRADAGKVKRIRLNGAVRIAPCTMRGRVTGDWTNTRATIVTGAAFDTGMRLLDLKYWPWKMIGDFSTRLFARPNRAVIAITMT